jgi:preprotein translocase subunit Sec61beta
VKAGALFLSQPPALATVETGSLGVAEMDWAEVVVLALAMSLDWTGQFIIVGVSTALLAVVGLIRSRFPRSCRVLIITIISGTVLVVAGWIGFLRFLQSQGPGALPMSPDSILYACLVYSMNVMLQYAPLIGALAEPFAACSSSACAAGPAPRRDPRVPPSPVSPFDRTAPLA